MALISLGLIPSHFLKDFNYCLLYLQLISVNACIALARAYTLTHTHCFAFHRRPNFVYFAAINTHIRNMHTYKQGGGGGGVRSRFSVNCAGSKIAWVLMGRIGVILGGLNEHRL